MVETTNNYLGTTRDGYNIYDRQDSHIHAEGGLNKSLIRTALRRMYANGTSLKKKEIYFYNPIGFSTCVPVEDGDDVVMVYRKGREGKTPMVRNRKPIPCNILTVIIRKEPLYNNHYTLITCYIGKMATREPWDKNISTDEERKKCEEFWSSHALIYDPSLIDFERT